MQKESPKRGWQRSSVKVYVKAYEGCKKNHPKGDGNYTLYLNFPFPAKDRCRKNHPKGDGNSGVLSIHFPSTTTFFRCRKNHPKGDGNLCFCTAPTSSRALFFGCRKNHPKGDGNVPYHTPRKTNNY